MHSGLITSSIYPMKYLIDLFVPYGSFFKTNILLTSTSILIIFYCFIFYCRNHFFILLSPKILFFQLILILSEKKVKFFI